ncbi:protein LpqN [Mycolicibacterium novocastrense]|uniref:Protein LpqN n=2 Tax=Mycolicibacterium novocastrense TaxID=59813 RepID=A0ABQ0KFR5_MYCNV|nr:protein LpqN [Mycolicibacterium novocastrense]
MEEQMGTSMRAGIVAVAAVALGLGLAGCSSDTEGEAASDTTTSEPTTTSETSASPAPTTSPQAQGANYTIVDYIRENDITETPVKRGDPGSPTIDLPFPPGWSDAGPRTPEWAWGAIVSDDPAMAEDPPTIIALVSKLTGNVDPAKILEFAPGEIKNLPGYDGAQEGSPSTLSDFEAVQIGGTYTKDGVLRAIAQKTVVIPGQDGLYVLQLNADGREDQMMALMDATSVIDEQTKITP